MFWKKGSKKEGKDAWIKPSQTGKWCSDKSLVAKLDKIYSKYIRLRDSKAYGFKYFRCISCGRVLPIEQGDCGHYISRRNMALRFCEENTWTQCRYCNRFKDGDILNYRQGLISKIGERNVELLESRRFESKKWSKWELEKLIDHYTEKVKFIYK